MNLADAECGTAKASRASRPRRPSARPVHTRASTSFSGFRSQVPTPYHLRRAALAGDCRRSQVRGRASRSPARSPAARARAPHAAAQPYHLCVPVRSARPPATLATAVIGASGGRRCLRGGGSSGGRTGLRYARHPSRAHHTTPVRRVHHLSSPPRPPSPGSGAVWCHPALFPL